jgi:hypothetical protein
VRPPSKSISYSQNINQNIRQESFRATFGATTARLRPAGKGRALFSHAGQGRGHPSTAAAGHAGKKRAADHGASRRRPCPLPSPVCRCIRRRWSPWRWRGASIVKRQWTYGCGGSEQCVYEHTDEAVTVFVPRAPGPSRICDGADDCGGDCETVPVHVQAPPTRHYTDKRIKFSLPFPLPWSRLLRLSW